MKVAVVVFFLLAGVVTFSRCGGDKNETESSTEGENVTVGVSGEEVYQQQCTLCHGSNGDLGASGASALSMSKLDLNQRIEVVTNGRAKMMAYSGLLSEEEIKAVAEYLETLKK